MIKTSNRLLEPPTFKAKKTRADWQIGPGTGSMTVEP